MALPKAYVNELVAALVAWYHETRRPVPKGLAPYSGTVGVVKRRMIRTWQAAHHLPVTGEFDTATQHHLIPPDPRMHKAAATVAYCEWGVQHHSQFHYAQDRPIHSPTPPDLYSFVGIPRRRVRDCSAFAKDAVRAGGFQPLDDQGILYGNTYTMLDYAKAHGRLRPIASLRQADCIIFSNPGHIVIVTGTHLTNPQGVLWLTGDGHEGAPNVTTLQAQIDSHPGAYYGIAVD